MWWVRNDDGRRRKERQVFRYRKMNAEQSSVASKPSKRKSRPVIFRWDKMAMSSATSRKLPTSNARHRNSAVQWHESLDQSDWWGILVIFRRFWIEHECCTFARDGLYRRFFRSLRRTNSLRKKSISDCQWFFPHLCTQFKVRLKIQTGME